MGVLRKIKLISLYFLEKIIPNPYGYYLIYFLKRILGRKEIFFSLETAQATIKNLKKLENIRTIWFVPTIPWFSYAYQRPHHIASAMANNGFVVIFHEPWTSYELFKGNDEKERNFIGLKEIKPNLFLLRSPEIFDRYFLRHFSPNFMILNWPFQYLSLVNKISTNIIYDIVDDTSLIPDFEKNWGKIHEKLINKAKYVLVSADDLYSKTKELRDDILKIPNGVVKEDWGIINEFICPEEIEMIRNSKAIIGYYGAIAEWFDWEMWNYAAMQRPDWAFVLIGFPYEEEDKKIIKENISKRKNLYFFGPKPYPELKYYLAHFDVATIPFKLNNLTHACSPVKLFEYMAGGKPIVTSKMREVLKYKSVLAADDPQDFVNKLEEALMLRENKDYLRILEYEASSNTWDSRVKTLISHLEKNSLPDSKLTDTSAFQN